MSSDGDIKLWKCGKGGSVNLQKVSSIVRDIGEPCLHQSPIKINKMLKPDKWQATFDSDGKVFGFQKALKLIILGGVDPSIRPQVWEFLLGCYALSSTAEYRRQLRTARRERYEDLLKQCQLMHSSIGTGSLAYVVGSKVMDMRTSSKDEGIREPEIQSRQTSDVDTNRLSSNTNGSNKCIDTSNACKRVSSSDSGELVSVRRNMNDAANACKRESSSDSGELVSVRGNMNDAANACKRESSSESSELISVRGNMNDAENACTRESSSDSGELISVRGNMNDAAYDSSCFPPASPTSSQCKCSSTNLGNEARESNYLSDSYFDFPPLPVTDLFEKRKKDKKGRWSLDEGLSTRRRLRFGDEHMHSFRIRNNSDLVFESSNSVPNDILRTSNPEIEVVCTDDHEPVPWSGSLEDETEMLNGLRISDAPENPAPIVATSQGGTGNEDRVSEWLWTLHRIVVDVVRTDSHLEFYEDTKNLARMSDILAVYAWVDPRTGYCQGMSDLLSPFVVLFEDNADAFWCFEMLLRRMRENFQMEGPTGVMKQLQALRHILELTDRELFSHLSDIGAESLHFAFRMLLVLFRRELSFSETLSMWEMMWAADFDESFACHPEENCPELLVIQIPRNSGLEIEESIENNTNGSKGGSSSKKGILEHSISDNTGLKFASAHPFCGLAKTFWSRNDRLHVSSALAAMGNGDDELPVFCVAAVLIMNRQKVVRETHSIDDLIKIFNDNLLKIRVKRCIRTAIKLRKKYLYKLIKNRSQAARNVD